MNRLLLAALLMLLATGTYARSPIEVTTKDGRTVILKPDGTWEFKKAASEPSSRPAIPTETSIPKNQQENQQERCNIGIDKSPSIRGLKLGMTFSAVRASFPGVAEPKRDEVGRSTVHISGADGDQNLRGIDSITLEFLDSKIFMMTVVYEREYWPEGMKLVEGLGPLSMNGQRARVDCLNFDATVFRASSSDKPYVEFTDTQAFERWSALSDKVKQKDCQRALAVRDVRLGMALAQFRVLYPRAQEVVKSLETGKLALHKTNGGEPRLNGVTDLWASFLDGELYSFVIDYSPEVKWEGVDQFVAQFRKGLGLLANWEPTDPPGSRALVCNDFIIQAAMQSGHPRVTMQNFAGFIKLHKREEQLKSPKSFRP